MFIKHLWLTDFRNYESVDATFPESGVVAIVGNNGQGKTNLLESIGYLARLSSFRGVTTDTLIRSGLQKAVVRGEGERQRRDLLVETELNNVGRNRTLVNKQQISSSKDLVDGFYITVFSPSDLHLIQEGPSLRRNYLDQMLSDLDKQQRRAQSDLERVLKQRNTVLRQSKGRLSAEIVSTLDVWDQQLSRIGESIGTARAQLVDQLQPIVDASYSALAGNDKDRIGMSLLTQWRQEDGGKGLLESLIASRETDVVRGVTTVGPHRDELLLTISAMQSRTHASQGEQRTLALAMRMASHFLLKESLGAPPILLLDDVFSELDPFRSRALLESVPKGQTFLTTASDLPKEIEPDLVLKIEEGGLK